MFCQYKLKILVAFFFLFLLHKVLIGPAQGGRDTLTQIPGLRAAAPPENHLLGKRLSKSKSQQGEEQDQEASRTSYTSRLLFSKKSCPQLHL